MATTERMEVFEDQAGKWRYRRVAANNQVTDPSQGYTTRSSATRAARADKPELVVHVLVEGKPPRVLASGASLIEAARVHARGLASEQRRPYPYMGLHQPGDVEVAVRPSQP